MTRNGKGSMNIVGQETASTELSGERSRHVS